MPHLRRESPLFVQVFFQYIVRVKSLKEGTTYNQLKPPKPTYNHLQPPTTTSKNSTTIYNHRKHIYNHPQTIEYHLKQAINV